MANLRAIRLTTLCFMAVLYRKAHVGIETSGPSHRFNHTPVILLCQEIQALPIVIVKAGAWGAPTEKPLQIRATFDVSSMAIPLPTAFRSKIQLTKRTTGASGRSYLSGTRHMKGSEVYPDALADQVITLWMQSAKRRRLLGKQEARVKGSPCVPREIRVLPEPTALGREASPRPPQVDIFSESEPQGEENPPGEGGRRKRRKKDHAGSVSPGPITHPGLTGPNGEEASADAPAIIQEQVTPLSPPGSQEVGGPTTVDVLLNFNGKSKQLRVLGSTSVGEVEARLKGRLNGGHPLITMDQEGRTVDAETTLGTLGGGGSGGVRSVELFFTAAMDGVTTAEDRNGDPQVGGGEPFCVPRSVQGGL